MTTNRFLVALLALAYTAPVAAQVPTMYLTGPIKELVRPSALVSDPGYQANNTGSKCHRADILASFFNLDVVKLPNGTWLMALQDGPQLSGCGPFVGDAFGKSDQTYLYKSTGGPLGRYLPIAYSGAGVILCQESKDSNIGMYSPDSVNNCDLSEGFWGMGSFVQTVHNSDLFMSQEKGTIVDPILQESKWAYTNTINNQGVATSDRRLMLFTGNTGLGLAKPYLFRWNAGDTIFPFFINYFTDDGSFSNPGKAFGYIKFSSYPTSYSVALMDSVGNNVTLPANRTFSSIGNILSYPMRPLGSIRPIGTVIPPAQGNFGFGSKPVMFYSLFRNGDGPSCSGSLHGGKESLIGYASFVLNSDANGNPVWGGWGPTRDSKVVQTTSFEDYQFDGNESITNVDVVPINSSSGYIFWAQATNCNTPQDTDLAIYGSQYSLLIVK
jgi:hypothetical protein